MPYRNKQMLRDANGDLLPQYWDVVEQEFKPLTGSDGANDIRLTGSIVEEVEIVNYVKNRDTSSHWELVDLSMFKSFTLIAYNTLNEYPTIAYRTPSSTTLNRVMKNGKIGR